MHLLKFGKFYFFFILISFLQLHANHSSIVKSSNASGFFTFYLLNHSQNLVMSPCSLVSPLYMSYLGSRGDTAKELSTILNIKNISPEDLSEQYSYLKNQLHSENSSIKIGNSLWVEEKKSILSSYSHLFQKNFNGYIENETLYNPKIGALKINKWVSDYTNDKIRFFIQPSEIEPLTKMAFVNTISFQGEWPTPFLSKNTGIKPFFSHNKKWVNSLMMQQISSFPYYEDSDTQIIAFPFNHLNHALRFVIFLPKEHPQNVFNFYYAKEQTQPGTFFNYLNSLEKKELNVTIPKFFINQKLNIGDLLSSIGMKLSLSDQANFSGITGKKNLMISKAFQHNFISINELGVSAAASDITFIHKAETFLDTTSHINTKKLSFEKELFLENLHSTFEKKLNTSANSSERVRFKFGIPAYFYQFRNGKKYLINNKKTEDTSTYFIANKPFLYAIFDTRSKLFLFIGEYTDPHQMKIKEKKGK